MIRRLPILFAVMTVLLLAPAAADAGSVRLAWDANAEPDLAGYVIVYGTQSNAYPNSVDVGRTTQWEVTGLTDGVTYFFAVLAYNIAGLRGPLSNEVSTTVGVPAGTKTLRVTLAGTGGGYVDTIPAGLGCAPFCEATFSTGQPVTLRPAAASGSSFGGWSGDADCADGQVTMSADRACTATFVELGPGLSFVPGTAPAQVVSGPAHGIVSHDVAYDPVQNVYLLVWGVSGGAVRGRFLDGQGQALGAAFKIAPRSALPRVAAGPSGQPFLVTFTNGAAERRGRFITYVAGGTPTRSGPRVIAPLAFPDGVAAGATFASPSTGYLVTWWDRPGGGAAQSFARALKIDGTLGPVVTLASGSSSHRLPEIACGPAGCLAVGETVGGATEGIWARFLTTSGATASSLFYLQHGNRTHRLPRVDFGPLANTYVVTWIRNARPVAAAFAQGVTSQPSIAPLDPAKTAEVDALAHNPTTDRFAVAMQGHAADIWAQGLTGAGAPFTQPFVAVSGGTVPEGKPVVAANPALGEFLVVYRMNGKDLWTARIR
jgi:hypothetical protein